MSAVRVGRYEVAHRPGRVYLTDTAPLGDPGMPTDVAWQVGVALCVAACDADPLPEEVTHGSRVGLTVSGAGGHHPGSPPATKEATA